MSRRKRKKQETRSVSPALPGGSRRKYVAWIVAGVATAVVAGSLLVLLPSGRTSGEPAENRLETGFAANDWSGIVEGLASVEGPAAEFQAEVYRIVGPLAEKLPNSTHAHCLLASAHRHFARKAEAARELQQALALDPACAEAHYTLGIMALGECDYAEAEKHLLNAFDNDPRWADVPLQLAKSQISQDKNLAAVETLEEYLKLVPKNAEAWCQLGQAYQRLGDFGNAKRCHLTAIDLDPESLEAHYGVAMALRELGAADESREHLDRFGQLRSSMTDSVRSNKASLNDEDFIRTTIVETATKAGAVYAMHGLLAEAEKCWTKATELNPAHTECWAMLCRLRPDDPGRWLSLGYSYFQNGRPAEAGPAFQRVIELTPQQAAGYAALAELRIRLDEDAGQAVQLAQRAVQLEPTARNYSVLAAACERAEDWSGAESALNRAIELDPDDPRYPESLARLQKGRP